MLGSYLVGQMTPKAPSREATASATAGRAWQPDFSYSGDPVMLASNGEAGLGSRGYAGDEVTSEQVAENGRVDTGDLPPVYDPNDPNIEEVVVTGYKSAATDAAFDRENPGFWLNNVMGSGNKALSWQQKIDRLPYLTTSQAINLQDRRFLTGPQMNPWDPVADQLKMDYQRHSIEIDVGGPLFGGFGAATRVFGGTESQVEGANQFGAALFDIVGGKAALPEREFSLMRPKGLYEDDAIRLDVRKSDFASDIQRLSEEGHALERHGGSVTDEQLYIRARTGIAPDGSKTRGSYTPTSTAFYSDESLVNTDNFFRQNYLEEAINNAGVGAQRVKVSGDMGVSLGGGYLPVGQKAGLQGPLLRVDNLTSAEAWYVRDPVKNIWQTNTIYPIVKKN